MKKIFITQTSDIGIKCYEWARNIDSDKFQLVNSIENSDIYFSIFHNEIFKEKIINTRLGINFHAGLLPKYRGSGTINWAIINEEIETGITIHEIDKRLDAGPVIDVKKITIEQTDTAETLYKKLELITYELFKDWLIRIIDGDFIAKKQSELDAHLYRRSELKDAKNLTKFARAFTFQGKESAFYFTKSGKKIYIQYED